jgi:hypothetical protein
MSDFESGAFNRALPPLRAFAAAGTLPHPHGLGIVPVIERNLIHYSLNRSIVSPIYTRINRRLALMEQILPQLNLN